MTILLTGGAGFIGSHMAADLMSKGLDFLVLDNFSNSDRSNLNKLEVHFQKKIDICSCDLRDRDKLLDIFSKHNFESVIHFAALKSVPESIHNPKLYFDNNVGGSKNLMEMVKYFKITNFIFSSSATVYGEPQYLPIDESHPINSTSPYGQTKIDTETLLLNDSYFSERCSTKILRYFNPVGAYLDGLIGEKPNGVPSNLMPYILGVAAGRYPLLKVFGDDYPTPDGTAIRDYVHVMDLIDAHFLAMRHNVLGIVALNVGTGSGYSVLDLLHTFEKVNEISIPFEIYPRRAGDSSSVFADTKKIQQLLGWSATRDLRLMCQEAFKFSKHSG